MAVRSIGLRKRGAKLCLHVAVSRSSESMRELLATKLKQPSTAENGIVIRTLLVEKIKWLATMLAYQVKVE